MPDKKLLLIHPPFSMPDKPYISTAVLYSHLKDQGVDVSVLDLSLEFYREHLSPDAIKSALEFMDKRFHALDHRHSLDSLEIQEYLKLVHLKKRLAAGEAPPFHLLFQNCDLGNVEQFMLFGLAVEIVNTRYFPDSLEFLVSTGYIRHKSRFSKFSSHDILQSLEKPSLYSSAIQKIITGHVGGQQLLMVGISVSFPDQVLPAFYAASVIRLMDPTIHICFGGTFVSSHMRDLGNIRLFDYVDTFVLDEGERPLLELTRCLTESKPWDDIPGLVYARDGQIIQNEPARFPESLPLTQPDYGCADLDRYLVNTRSMALLCRLSQGCYWRRCSFCRTGLSFVNHHVRGRTEDITAWISDLVERCPVRILHFTDDAAEPETLDALSGFLIRRNTPLFWVTNMRFDSRITHEKLALYKKAGCRAIYFGLESCCERVLKTMKKGIALPCVERVLADCADIGIPVHLYMIVGFPTETEKEARESFSRVYEWKKQGLARQVIYNVFEISAGSDIAETPGNYGITDVESTPSLDLAPPVTRFTSGGMERKTAEALCLEFISRLAHARSGSPGDMMALLAGDTQEKTVRDIETRHDIEAIKAAIDGLYQTHPQRNIPFVPLPGFTFPATRRVE